MNRSRNTRRAVIALLVFFSLTCAACGSSQAPAANAFIPPTLDPQVTPPVSQPSATPAADSGAIQAVPTPACVSNLSYLEDLTIPDGTQVFAGQSLDKRWLVENTGSCNWDDRYSLRLVSGSSMGASEILALYPARGGIQASIRIELTAPNEPGAYRSAWQAYDPQGQPFGDPIYIDIVVSQ